jgi:hypothetical protein
MNLSLSLPSFALLSSRSLLKFVGILCFRALHGAILLLAQAKVEWHQEEQQRQGWRRQQQRRLAAAVEGPAAAPTTLPTATVSCRPSWPSSS